MNREKKLKYNTILALVNQIIAILCGFILPRFYLQTYGSVIYGLSSSITQFLGFVTLMELGMGAVVQSALYKPLAQKDDVAISKIIKSAEIFFRKIALVFLIYTIGLMFVYPFLIRHEFNWWFEASLIFVISISTLAEYFFGMTYRLLLLADQKAYISLALQSVGLVLNFIICIVLMRLGASIQIVKLASAIVLLIRPLGQNIYVKRHYNIAKKIVLTEEPIAQKWNGIAQHLAYYVTINTDTIILSIFSTLQNVSIYSVYNMVVNGIKQLILTLTTGIQALFGNMLAQNEYDELSRKFKEFEWTIHNIVIILFTCVGVLIVPFISVYTRGINDTNYIHPLFAFLLTIAQATYCIRIPYLTLVNAAGHYKQTQTSAIIEMLLNLGFSIILVKKYDLIGVALGTLIALTYKTVYLALYLSHNIINYQFSTFLYNLVIDGLIVVFSVFFTSNLIHSVTNYWQWIFMAIQVFGIVLLVTIVINLIFNKKYVLSLFRRNEA